VADFRAPLYARYVSTFKRELSRADERRLRSYWSWCEHRYRPLLAGLSPEARLLELGCGSGQMLEFLRREGFRNAAGIDLSPEQVAIARERGLDVQVADVFEHLARERGDRDAVLALDLFEHFDRPELLRLTAAVHGALVPGGRLILQTPNGGGLLPGAVVHGDLTHLTIFTPGSLMQLLAPAGFGEFTFVECGPVAKNLRGRVRRLLWRAVRGVANALRRIESGHAQEIWTASFICCCRKLADERR
jgi:SAM-dependent methyltransferase